MGTSLPRVVETFDYTLDGGGTVTRGYSRSEPVSLAVAERTPKRSWLTGEDGNHWVERRVTMARDVHEYNSPTWTQAGEDHALDVRAGLLRHQFITSEPGRAWGQRQRTHVGITFTGGQAMAAAAWRLSCGCDHCLRITHQVAAHWPQYSPAATAQAMGQGGTAKLLATLRVALVQNRRHAAEELNRRTQWFAKEGRWRTRQDPQGLVVLFAGMAHGDRMRNLARHLDLIRWAIRDLQNSCTLV